MKMIHRAPDLVWVCVFEVFIATLSEKHTLFMLGKMISGVNVADAILGRKPVHPAGVGPHHLKRVFFHS